MKQFILSVAVILFAASLCASAVTLKSGNVKYLGGVPVMVSDIQVPVKATVENITKFVKNDFLAAFNLGESVKLIPLYSSKVDSTEIFRYSYTYKGLNVENSFTTVSVKNGKIYRVNNSLGNINIDVTNLISEEQAVKAALIAHSKNAAANMPKHYAEKLIVSRMGQYHAAYKVRFMPVSLADARYYYVDAKTGAFLFGGNNIMYADAEPLTDNETTNDDTAVASTDKAKVWPLNPIKSPEMVEIDLPWVAAADDPDLTATPGFLVTDKDKQGIRRIKAYNCPNKHEKVEIDASLLSSAVPAGTLAYIPLCSPTPMANKVTNSTHDFVYDDCAIGAGTGGEFSTDNMSEEKIDKCAEIHMYYHAAKMYQYLRQLGTTFKYLSGTTAENPLSVIGNFQMPDINSTNMAQLLNKDNTIGLVAMDNAMFSPENPMYTMVLEKFGIKGDMLIFGQGNKADFGFDGDVVYHELGHATVYTTGLDSAPFIDKYGPSNEPGSLHEGLGDTFSFIMSGDPCTGEYASKGLVDYNAAYAAQMDKDPDGNYCMRYAIHQYKVFEDFIGEVHFDGQPILAANWAIYTLAVGDKTGAEKQTAVDNFTKLLMKTLYGLGTKTGFYKLFGDTLMTEVKNDDNFKAMEADIQKILTDLNFFTEIRARNAATKIAQHYIDAGGANNALGMTVDEAGTQVGVAPSYLQLYYDVPADFAKGYLMVTGAPTAQSSGGIGVGSTGTIDAKIYVRKGEPVLYEKTDAGYSVTKDATIEKDKAGNLWYIPVVAGSRYYFHFVNYGTGGGAILNISVVGADKTVETTDADTIGSDVAGTVDEEEVADTDVTVTKKKDDGCGCTIVF